MPFLVYGVFVLVTYLGKVPIGWGGLILINVLVFLGTGSFFIIIGLFLLIKAIRQKEFKKIKEKEEGLGIKIEAAPNVSYMLRIEKEIGESGVERVNYICGYCGLKNNLKTIDEENGIFQCLNCGAENHIIK